MHGPVAPRLLASAPSELREFVALHVEVDHARARREAAVHALALLGAPMLAGLLSPARLGPWLALAERGWGVVLATTVGCVALEFSARRRLRRRTLRCAERASHADAHPRR